MKIIFLDIDGVLNRKGTKERCFDAGVNWVGVDRELAHLFTSWLAKQDKIQIVLSSTWRKHQGMWKHLNDAGIFWFDTTPIMKVLRGIEINKWLEEFTLAPVEKFAILDDMNEFLPQQAPYFVQTGTDVGLTPSHLLQLESILNGADYAKRSALADGSGHLKPFDLSGESVRRAGSEGNS